MSPGVPGPPELYRVSVTGRIEIYSSESILKSSSDWGTVQYMPS